MRYRFEENRIFIQTKDELNDNQDWVNLGYIDFQIKELTILDFPITNFGGGVIVIVDDPEQQVFDNSDNEKSFKFIGPQIIYDEASGIYFNNKTKQQKPVMIRFHPLGIALSGEVDGTITSLRSY